MRAFRDIVLPILRPSLISLWTLMFILIFMELSVTVVLYSPESITLQVLVWSQMSGGYLTSAFAIAAVQATVIFAVIFTADRLFGMLSAALGQTANNQAEVRGVIEQAIV